MRTVLFALLLTVGAAHAAEPRVFGEAMPAGDATPVAAVLAGSHAAAEAPHKFSGRITEVCQKKGCWVVLSDGDGFVRVMARDHGFSVPKDARGQAEVFGVLRQIDLKPEVAQHLREDGEGGLPVVEREWRIDATSIALLD